MEARWLDDFITLVETRSFTRAAECTHSSQSALSRRIQALERWAGATLVDRDAHPLALTDAGQRFYQVAAGLRGTLEATRQLVRQDAGAGARPVRIAVQAGVSPGVAARWLAQAGGRCRTHLMVMPLADALPALAEGQADLVLCMQHRRLPVALDPLRHQSRTVGRDALLLASAPGPDGRPRHALHGTAGAPVPFLDHAPASYLAQVAALMLRDLRERWPLQAVCESACLEALRAMALAGHGLACLPESAVRDDFARGALLPVAPAWRAELDLLLLRETVPQHRIGRRHPAADALWTAAHAGVGPGDAFAASTGMAPAPPHLVRAASAAEDACMPCMPA